VTWSVQPEPSDEGERRALLAALEQALAEDQDGSPYSRPWWRSGLDDLGGRPTAEEPWGEPGVVEP
jgi:hypothetical protein